MEPKTALRTEQRARLEKTIGWARKLRAELQPILDAHGNRVHFRPSSTGVTMLGLLSDRPLRGKGRISNLAGLADDFEARFAAQCMDVPHGRVSDENALQSFLIRDAQTHGRRLAALDAAAATTDDPVELTFVTDEIALPIEGGKRECGVLALRQGGGRMVPVVLELKDTRWFAKLVEKVEGYAALVDAHPELFAELYEALLGEDVRFTGATEKWIVWPAAGTESEPREDELAARGIRVVGYTETRAGYTFRVGRGVGGGAGEAAAGD